MNRARRILLHAAAVAVTTVCGSRAVNAADATTPSPAPAPMPHLQDVTRLLRTNLEGVTDDQLNAASVQGLLDRFAPRVQLVTGPADPVASTNTDAVTRATVYDQSFALIRVARVQPGLESRIRSAWDGLASSNKLKGLVLDLRFASGTDYAAAASVADLFVTTERPLVTWGDNTGRSTRKDKPLASPVAVLVNRQTSGAAEALAGVLRWADSALILGAPTAGQASLYKEFPLPTGQRLRIASTGVTVAGDHELSTAGLTPDVVVDVDAAAEKAWFQDPFLAPGAPEDRGDATTATNRPRRRVNEAELVRRRRDGGEVDDPPPGSAPAEARRATGSGTPAVKDPALSRALDLLRAIALLQAAPAR